MSTCEYCRGTLGYDQNDTCRGCGAPISASGWAPWTGVLKLEHVNCVLPEEYIGSKPPPEGYTWDQTLRGWRPPSMRNLSFRR
ncbi:hypothetical protein [Acidovorax phage ACPWH]|nr:hypothetical protein [Acidovorax phage ACPWH]QXV72256.1 hypothetical protein Acf1_00059 [Acidovorax phage ACF1]